MTRSSSSGACPLRRKRCSPPGPTLNSASSGISRATRNGSWPSSTRTSASAATSVRASGRKARRTCGRRGAFSTSCRIGRIVSAGTMHKDEVRISMTLCTVEISSDGDGARLKLTDQSAFLDGRERPDERRSGWGEVLDRLARFLARLPDLPSLRKMFDASPSLPFSLPRAVEGMFEQKMVSNHFQNAYLGVSA